jgi:hypothetical protein
VSVQKEKGFKVSASEKFVKLFNALPTNPPVKYPAELSDQTKVASFVQTYLSVGMDPTVLLGKDVSSDNVPTDDPQWLEKVKYAQEHALRHYHIGIPYYVNSGKGYFTSEYVLHYQQIEHDHIKLVDMSWHPPMSLPSEDYLEGEIPLGNSKQGD